MESLEEIRLRLTSKDPEQRIDALLDAWEYGTAGIELIKCCLVQIWDTKKLKLVQTLDNLPKLTITSVGVRPNRTIIACGEREDKVCAWELQSDRIIYTASEMSPCILSTDGRVLIYATAKYEIVIRDLVAEQELITLQGHQAAIAYLALSEDRQFLASYSIDRQIKIWGILDHS